MTNDDIAAHFAKKPIPLNRTCARCKQEQPMSAFRHASMLSYSIEQWQMWYVMNCFECRNILRERAKNAKQQRSEAKRSRALNFWAVREDFE